MSIYCKNNFHMLAKIYISQSRQVSAAPNALINTWLRDFLRSAELILILLNLTFYIRLLWLSIMIFQKSYWPQAGKKVDSPSVLAALSFQISLQVAEIVRLKALSSSVVGEPHLESLGKANAEKLFLFLCSFNSCLSHLIVGTIRRFQNLFVLLP